VVAVNNLQRHRSLGRERRSATGGALLGAYTPLPAQRTRPPNIVLILADDLRLCRFGMLPNIDRLAAEGMRFTDVYSLEARVRPVLRLSASDPQDSIDEYKGKIP
jgi:hypothetical protein